MRNTDTEILYQTQTTTNTGKIQKLAGIYSDCCSDFIYENPFVVATANCFLIAFDSCIS